MTVVIYTAMAGGYDTLLPQVAQDIDVEWHAFTDGLDVPAPWTPIRYHGRGHPRMVAKAPKCQPHRYLPATTTVSIWIDANMAVTSPSFARDVIGHIRDGWALWAHPDRDCIYDEAIASVVLAPAKYAHLDPSCAEQVDQYRLEDHPAHGGLYAAGMLARQHDRVDVDVIGDEWLDECEAWTYQDQLSLPVLFRRHGITPGVIAPGPRLGDPWLTIHRHHART